MIDIFNLDNKEESYQIYKKWQKIFRFSMYRANGTRLLSYPKIQTR